MTTRDIATAPRANSRHWKPGTITWGEVVAWLDDPADHKDCGGYVLGRIEPTTDRHRRAKEDCTGLHRTQDGVVSRGALTLDADMARADLPERVQARGVATVMHTTWRTTPDAPRYRIIILLSRPVTRPEYQAIARHVMKLLGAEQFDKGSAEPERFMWKPSAKRPEDFESWAVAGEPLDVEATLLDAAPDEPEPEQPQAAPVPGDATASPEYVQAAVAGALGDLDALATLPEHETNHRDHGWDTGTFTAACQLVRASNSGQDYTRVQAEGDFLRHAPPAVDEYNPEHKWDQAVKVVGTTPLDPQGRPQDDFAPVVPGAAAESGKDEPSSSWEGIDLTGYLDGTYRPPTPELLVRTDGVGLLYPGLTHSIHGESESGKSLVVQHESVRLIMAGRPVLYLDFESDPASIVERLRLLGASVEAIQGLFVYVQPATDPERYGPDLAALEATLAAHPYALAVIDGVSESMSVVTGDGKGYNEDAIDWARKVPQRIARETGAAVVQIDHVTKNAETRGRFAIGGQAKMAGLTGAAYALDVVRPLGRGLLGELVLRVAKDRPGYIRGRSGEHRAGDRTQEAARVQVDSTGPELVMTVVPPTVGPKSDEKQALLMGRISQWLGENVSEGDDGASTNLIKDAVTGKRDEIAAALQVLVDLGYVTRIKKGQSLRHHLKKAYTPEFEGPEQ